MRNGFFALVVVAALLLGTVIKTFRRPNPATDAAYEMRDPAQLLSDWKQIVRLGWAGVLVKWLWQETRGQEVVGSNLRLTGFEHTDCHFETLNLRIVII